jgi:cytochrome c oxidase subunit 2
MNNHSALDSVGPHAARIEQLWWLFFDVSVVTYLVVIAALVIALVRSRRRTASEALVEQGQDADSKSRTIVGAAVAITAIVLIVLATSDFFVGRALARPMPDPVRIKIVGQQWWWDIEYEDPDPSQRLRTANELHVPVGRPVQLSLTSRDVIHSFWLPNIDGKKDLIPGHMTSEQFVVEREGIYEGQCAEFCGHQHANMRLILHADSPARFEEWKAAQLQPARQPNTPEQQKGKEVFETSTCAMCHSIRGSTAGGTVAPDLTHLKSRSTIAAGVLPNTKGHLGGWIGNPQQIKPGVRMPSNSLPAQDFRALLSYLETLQ